jgi:hypothetical protein
MTVTASFHEDTWRVQLLLADFANGAVLVERSDVAGFPAGRTFPVRGGLALPIEAGAAVISDHEYRDRVLRHYRVTQASTEDNIMLITVTGQWSKPAGLVAVKAVLVQPGSGGGGVAATAAGENAEAGGGAYGSIVVAWIPAADLDDEETVTIGAVGAAGTAGANAGGAGGAVSFTRTVGTDLSVSGGSGGSGSPATSGNAQNTGGSSGLTTTGADLIIPGEIGHYGLIRGGLAGFGGRGAGGMFGPGARTTHAFSAAGSAPAGGFGGGGSGARNAASQAARAGGAGAPGCAIIEHYFADVT